MSKRRQHTAPRNPFATEGSHPTTHATELRGIVCFWLAFYLWGIYRCAVRLHFHENSVHEERGRRASAKLCSGRSREFGHVLHKWRAIKSIISRYFGSRYKVWSTPFDRRRRVCDVGGCRGNLQLHKLTKTKLPAAKRFTHSSGRGCEPSGANGLRHRCAKRMGITERIGDPHPHPRAREACHGRAGSTSEVRV